MFKSGLSPRKWVYSVQVGFLYAKSILALRRESRLINRSLKVLNNKTDSIHSMNGVSMYT